MTTYSVLAKVTVSCWTEVEADSESEALRIASNREIAGIFMDESSEVSECWHMDADGVPHQLRIGED